MVDRNQGGPLQGVWFSKDVKFMEVSVTNGGTSFLTELEDSPTGGAVNGKLEQVIELVAQRATVIGITVLDADTVYLMLDYANAYPLVVAATTGVANTAEVLATEINAIADLSVATITTREGFAPALPGTPA